MLLGIPWMPPSESRRCLCQLQWDWLESGSREPKFLLIGNVAVDLCPPPLLFLAYTGVVCLSGWYTGPGINELLVPGPGGSVGGFFKTNHFHFSKLPFVHLFQKDGEEPFKGFLKLKRFDSDVQYLWTEQLELGALLSSSFDPVSAPLSFRTDELASSTEDILWLFVIL